MKARLHKTIGIALAVVCIAALVALVGCTSSSSSSASSSSGSSGLPEATDVKQSAAPAVYDKPFYVLVVGNDTRIGTVEITRESYADGNARADTCMLVRVDPINYKVTLVTVPRDTAAEIDGKTRKIDEAYQFHGMPGILDQVKQLTGVECRYYFNMTFVQFVDFINQLGGVTVNVPVDMSMQDIVGGEQIELTAGEQKLNGAEALVYTRMRKIFQESQDATRQIQDRALVDSAIRMVANNPALAGVAVDAIVGHSETNWNRDDLLRLVNMFCEHAPQLQILAGTGPYEGDEQGDFWLTTRDEETWHKLIDVVNEGGDPTTVVPLPKMVL